MGEANVTMGGHEEAQALCFPSGSFLPQREFVSWLHTVKTQIQTLLHQCKKKRKERNCRFKQAVKIRTAAANSLRHATRSCQHWSPTQVVKVHFSSLLLLFLFFPAPVTSAFIKSVLLARAAGQRHASTRKTLTASTSNDAAEGHAN